MSDKTLLGIASLGVLGLAAAVLLVGWAAWHAPQSFAADRSADHEPAKTKITAPIYVFINEKAKDDDGRAHATKQSLEDVWTEVRLIRERQTSLVAFLRTLAEEDRGRATLIGIRDALALIAKHLTPPITVLGTGVDGTGGITQGEVLVRHRIEAISEEFIARIREALGSVVVTVNVQEGDGRDGPVTTGCRLFQLASVGSFPVGKHELREPSHTRAGLDDGAAVGEEGSARARPPRCREVADGFLEQLDGRPLSHLFLIGRTDRMPFADRRYDGNRGLAQARASWVHNCLRDELPRRGPAASNHVLEVLKNRTVLLSAGPLHVPACDGDEHCDRETRSRDRSVDVFACLGERSTVSAESPGATG